MAVEISKSARSGKLVHAEITHTQAAVRGLSGMPRGLYYATVDILSVSHLFEPPEEGRYIGLPGPCQIAI